MKLRQFAAGAAILAASACLLGSCDRREIGGGVQPDGQRAGETPEAPDEVGLELIRPSPDGTCLVRARSGARFVAWGVNYDRDSAGRLLEDYWFDEWPTVVADFREMAALGANVVRVHLQTARFMKAPDEPDARALGQLARLVRLAEQTGLYLDVTGLGCYHRRDVPEWYDAMGEAERWDVQALFWESVARTCAASDAVFCYDLMNEPILPGEAKETDWLGGEFAGKCYVQRISLDLAGRSRAEVAKAWVDRLARAVRRHDRRHMVTVGVIPLALHFHPGAREPVFYSKEAGASLDLVSVHFYPERGELDKALDALTVYELGKPLVIEEMFPLKCSARELEAFVDGSRGMADGWISFYWGKTVEEYAAEELDLSGAIVKDWLERFRAKAPEVLRAGGADAR